MTDLKITDDNYLANYERLEKTLWFQRNRTRLFLYGLAIVYILIGLISIPEYNLGLGDKVSSQGNQVPTVPDLKTYTTKPSALLSYCFARRFIRYGGFSGYEGKTTSS